MIETIQVQMRMIMDGIDGTIKESQLRMLEKELRQRWHDNGSRLKGLKGRSDFNTPLVQKLYGAAAADDVRIHLDLREVDDFRIIYKDKIK